MPQGSQGDSYRVGNPAAILAQRLRPTLIAANPRVGKGLTVAHAYRQAQANGAAVWVIQPKYHLAGVAFLDLLEPGRGKFINPINQARSAIEAHQIAQWIAANRVDPSDTRLLNCEAIAAEPVAIDASAADIRRALVGQSEAFTLTALGAPACALGNGVYRWVLNNGFALDITVSEGEITHSELNR